MVEDDKFTCSSTKDKLLCFSFKIVIIMARLSPLVTLIIGYVLGYVLYPASQLWTCSCLYDDNADVNTAHAQPNFVARRTITVQSSKDIASPDTAQDESTVVEGEYGRKTAVYASWRRFLSSRPGSPAYMSLEYKVRGRIFIGIITAEKYLATRAKAIHETWARAMGLSSKVVFYVGADCNTSHPGLEAMNIVRLKNVRDTVYPPQRKVFEALKHMYRHYGNNYQWFVRADDDAYIRVTRLDRLLGRLDPNEKVYLGRAGVGRKEDVGRLQLKASERYCMGGPGVILSRATLRETTPHLDRCLEEVEVHNRIGRRGVAEGAWFNEDVELGRCISRTVGIQCSHSKEVMNYFIQDYESAALRPTTLWGKPLFRQLITLHPIKRPEHMYSVHQFYTVLSRQATHKSLVNAQNTINEMCRKIPANLLAQNLHRICPA